MLLAKNLDVLKNEHLGQRTLLPKNIYNVSNVPIPYGDEAIYLYNLKSNIWDRTRYLKHSFLRHGARILVSDQLIVMGGYPSVSWVRSVNSHTGEVKKMKSMTSPRYNMSLVYFENDIYSFGGEHNLTPLHSAAK